MPLKFKIGADPEFSIIQNGSMVSASEVLSKFFPGEYNRNIMGIKTKFGVLGNDGAAATGELRPNPADEPAKLVENIKGLLEAFNEKLSFFSITTSSSFVPVGGHIHLQIPKDWKHFNAMPQNGSSDEPKRDIYLKRATNQLATLCSPLLISENRINMKLRVNSGSYGRLGDCRFQVYDQANQIFGLEYRTPTAEWMTCPEVAKATLAYAAVCWHEIMYHEENIKKLKEYIIRTEQQADSIRNLAMGEYTALNRFLMREIAKHVRKFELYPKYKKEVEAIFRPDKLLALKEQVNYNPLIGFKVNLGKQKLKKKDLFSRMAFKKKLEKCGDLDALFANFRLPFNGDLGVEHLTNAFRERLLVFNAETNNKYYFFGVRQGFKTPIVFTHNGKILKGMEEAKTRADINLLGEIYGKIDEKYRNNPFAYRAPNNNLTNTSRARKIKENFLNSILYVGIPYNIRSKKEIKKFFEIIWELENNDIEKNAGIFMEAWTKLPEGDLSDTFKVFKTAPNNEPLNIVRNDSSEDAVAEYLRDNDVDFYESEEAQEHSDDGTEEESMPFKTSHN